jgi:hypothetical protein
VFTPENMSIGELITTAFILAVVALTAATVIGLSIAALVTRERTPYAVHDAGRAGAPAADDSGPPTTARPTAVVG